MLADEDDVIAQALGAGAKFISPAQSYDYGYMQGLIINPFGHHWLIEMIL